MKFIWKALLVVVLFAGSAHAQPSYFTLQASKVSGVAATTVTGQTSNLPQLGPGAGADILLNITNGGTATGTLQIWLEDSVDGGTTFDDLCSSNTFALGASAATQRFFISGQVVPSTITTAASTNITQGGATANETLAAGSCRQRPIGSIIRVREKITSPSGSPVGATYTITAVFR